MSLAKRTEIAQRYNEMHGLIVGVGKSPQPVDEAEIEAIRTVIQSGIACKPYPRLRTGQRVRVEDGALQGLTGVVMKHKDDYRLIISVTLLMRSVSVEIDRSWLKPIAAVPEAMYCRRGL